MSNFWDENSNMSNYDILQESMDEDVQNVLDEIDASEDVLEQSNIPQTPYALNNHESSVVTDAMVRLEQARLYEMLIKHNLFDGVKANPKAMQNVQNELKSYIINRLEILLGIKSEEKEEDKQPIQIEVEQPFNDIEVDFLKALAYKGTKGASVQGVTQKTIGISKPKDIVEDKPQSIKPLVQEPKAALKSLSQEVKQTKTKSIKKETNPKVKVSSKKPTKKAKASKAKVRRDGTISNAEAERIAREDMERMKNRKPVDQMTAEELLEANKKINSNKKRPQGAKPIPTSDQLNQMYTLQQHQTMGETGFGALINNIIANKK